MNFDKGSRGRGGKGGGNRGGGPGGKYNPDGFGCGMVLALPVLVLAALIALAVTS